jgi:hypothetical protein
MVMRQLSEYQVVIETDGGAIDVEELTDFLYHFRAVYAAALELTHTEQFDKAKSEFVAEKVRQKVHGMDWSTLAHLAHRDLGDNKLGILNIKRENPLTIVFEGVAVALTAAVILSGGKFKLGPLYVKLPPLGTGIQSLRDAFGKKPLRTKKKP